MPGIRVTIGGSIAGLKAALNQAESKVQTFGKKVKGALSGIGLAISGGALAYGFKRMVDDLDNMSKRSRALGVTVEEMQKLEYVANSTNMGFDQLSSGMAKSMQVVSQALGGDEKAVQKLQRLNVEIGKLDGANAYQIMEAIAAGAAQISDPVERVTALMDVMGAKVGKNAQFFTDFFDRIKAIEESGGIISNEDAQAAEQINQSLTEAAKALRAIVVETGVLKQLADAMVSLAEISREINSGNYFGKTMQRFAGDAAKRTLEIAANTLTLGGYGRAKEQLLEWSNTSESAAAGYVQRAIGTSVEAAALTPSESAAKAREDARIAAETEKRNAAVDAALVDFFGDLDAAVGEVADKVDPTKKPRSAMRGGADPTFTDALRRIGGDAGGVYRAGDNYARTTAEATKAMADNLDAMNRNGINLRG